MLVLAVLGLFAVTAPADTSVRVPGTALRFGLSDSVLSARGFARKAEARAGPCRFFGLAGAATLELEGGRLTRARLTVEGASPQEIAYVQDQLTQMGFRRRCARLEPDASVCDWSGRARVHIEVNGARLEATAEPPAPPAGAPIAGAGAALPPSPAGRDSTGATAAAHSPGAPAAARSDSPGGPPPASAAVPVSPDTLAVPMPGRTEHLPAAVVLDAPPPVYPEFARRARVQGRVWVMTLVDVDGRVLDARVRTGIPELNAAALRTARAYRFQGRTWRGAPCRYWVLVPVTFTLH
jgi:TonB family protein